ncbi:MAG: ATP-dependent sacrificial sulfur transferase LarE [Bradymonadia bacterium]
MNTTPLTTKHQHLRRLLKEMGDVLIAYSGGVDSAFLLHEAVQVLGDRAVALTARSGSYPPWELEEARTLAEQMGARMIEVDSFEMERPGYRANAGDRCYHCKTELFEIAEAHAEALSMGTLCYGAIPDDLGDHRPGMQAAKERSVRAPLIEAGLNKADIRQLSKAAGLPTWDKPASACLSSRFPYGTEITPDRLDQVARCEAGWLALGFRQFRARFHGQLVRLELSVDEMPRLLGDAALLAEVVRVGKEAGFLHVSLDLEGYRSGSANAALVQLDEPRQR